MSSIKQVQDLEKQLSQARTTITHMRTLIPDGGTNETDGSLANVPALHLPETSSKDRYPGPPVVEAFDEARKNIRNFSKGIFRPPPPFRKTGASAVYSANAAHVLPPKHITDRLLSHYRGSVHVYAPMLHWPTFVQQYEEIYRAGSFQFASHIWVALFYAVLACGTLMDPQPSGSVQEGEGANYLEMYHRAFNTASDEFTTDHVRSSLLMSIYLIEANLRSAGWVWMGAAVRIAQDLGLHTDKGPFPPLEAEMRKRLWWSVYNWDRYVQVRTCAVDSD